MSDEQFEELYSLIRVLLKKLKEQDKLEVINYNKGEEVKFKKDELVRNFNYFIMRMKQEI